MSPVERKRPKIHLCITKYISSAFTARTAVHEKDQIKYVIEDAEISLFISIISTLILAYLLHDIITAIGGVIFAVSLFAIYLERGDLI